MTENVPLKLFLFLFPANLAEKVLGRSYFIGKHYFFLFQYSSLCVYHATLGELEEIQSCT